MNGQINMEEKKIKLFNIIEWFYAEHLLTIGYDNITYNVNPI